MGIKDAAGPRHLTPDNSPRWALDGRLLPRDLTLSMLLELPRAAIIKMLEIISATEATSVTQWLAPLEPAHEVWASGVTYLRSRDARKAESTAGDVYDKVYEAERPELFMKATGWRVVGDGGRVRLRKDSRWNVPSRSCSVINSERKCRYCAGNDVSSRDIEGANPLYLPQAKIYDGACALGSGIVLAGVEELRDLAINVRVLRGGEEIFAGDTRTSRMKRRLEDLVSFLGRETTFPHGAFLMTGTGIVPPDSFNLQPVDVVEITVGECRLTNSVECS